MHRAFHCHSQTVHCMNCFAFAFCVALNFSTHMFTFARSFVFARMCVLRCIVLCCNVWLLCCVVLYKRMLHLLCCALHCVLHLRVPLLGVIGFARVLAMLSMPSEEKCCTRVESLI